MDVTNLYINLLPKESTQNHSFIKNDSYSRERRASNFCNKIALTFTQVFPKVLLGTNTNENLKPHITIGYMNYLLFFYRRMLLSWLFLHNINRKISHVHQFISEFLELQKYSKYSDCFRLFSFWHILFSLCCVLIFMALWFYLMSFFHRKVGIQ